MILLKNRQLQNTINVIHFVGIGGIGMSGIAEVMHNLGYKVQGSDISENANTKRLKNLGIKIFKNHDANNIVNISYLIISSAINSDNPELELARKQKIPIIKRAEMLAELMRLKCSIAVSGSHGKTTTTSLIACLFEYANLSPTVINGGIINNKSTNAYIGSSDYLIAEADESDATFINIPSTIGVITNIDLEHMDFYKNFDNLVQSFKRFIVNLPFYGFAVVCIDHPVVRKVVNNITERKIITYGIESDDANILALNINNSVKCSTFDVKITLPDINLFIEKINIPLLGKHNILNALAAISLGVELDFGAKIIKHGFKNFAGVKRRFTKVMEYNGALIVDDYAHHPIEIQATLATAKSIIDQQKNGGKIIAIFQPHRYSRLHGLFDDFIKCFSLSDQLYITEVFAAGEDSINGISSQKLVQEIRSSQNKHAQFIDSFDIIEQIIKDNSANGDIILCMGAGNISAYVNSLPTKLYG